MSSVVAVKNTIAFVFPDNAAQPTLPEMARFVKSLNGPREQLDSAYKNSEEKIVLIKYKSEKGMRDALSLNEVRQTFHYSNGTQVVVCMSEAGGNSQYIRVFDLPPELPDSALVAVLSKFGKIVRCVREKYPPEYELDLFTGVRGVYMDVESQIPPVLMFHNRRGRIFYRGSKLICFACGQEGHLKKSCGKRKAKPTVAVVDEEVQRNNTFAAVLAGTCSEVTPSQGNGDRVEQEVDSEREEVAAAANVSIALSASNVKETEKEEISNVKLSEENCQIIVTTAETDMTGKSEWCRIAAKEAEELRRQQEEKETEEQRQQRKKSATRSKTGSVSPPVKKKY